MSVQVQASKQTFLIYHFCLKIVFNFLTTTISRRVTLLLPLSMHCYANNCKNSL